MATQKTRIAAAVLGSMILAGCTTDQGAQGGDDGTTTDMGMGPGSDGTGSDGTGGGGGGGGGGGDPTDPGTTTGPTYPTAHPRIYLTPNRSRLTAALTARTPAAT